MNTKLNQCPRCEFTYSRYCKGRTCDGCAMNNLGICKCLTIKLDETCPYFKGAKDVGERLIDAEKVIEDLLAMKMQSGASSVSINEMISELKRQPKVEVVRCKDCKYAWIHPCGYINCGRNGPVDHEMSFLPEDFCSYGERRSDTSGDQK